MSFMLEQITPQKSLSQWSWISLLLSIIWVSLPLEAISWSQATAQSLSLEEQTAQLIMVPVWTQGPQENLQETLLLLEQYTIGGILFMQGSIEAQQQAAHLLQSKSKIPLLVAQDNEWGLQLRLNEALRFPRNLTLGAIQDNQLIYEYGKEVARQCKGVEVHLNFAPVIDINNNPQNPVIADRSYGENPHNVISKSRLYTKGLQEEGVIACAKHFPGHGDTSTDSHYALPVINKTIEDLDQLEWSPFHALIDEGIQSIMLGHLQLPAISPFPTSLCPTTVSSFLRKKLHFEGLIVTDALNMKAVTQGYAPGESELLALQAGNDLLVFPKNPIKSIQVIVDAATNNPQLQKDIRNHLNKILKVKENLGLDHPKNHLPVDLFSKQACHLRSQLFKQAITLVSCPTNTSKIQKKAASAFVQIGRDVSIKDALELIHTPVKESYQGKTPLLNKLQTATHIQPFFLPRSATKKEVADLMKALDSYDQIIIGLYEMNKSFKKDFGLALSTRELMKKLSHKKVFVCIFGSPYSLRFFDSSHTILMAYENDCESQIGCAEILLGKRTPSGKLPITASEQFKEGLGFNR